MLLIFFFFKQKTAYEMRISDWSSDVCSSDLLEIDLLGQAVRRGGKPIDLTAREFRILAYLARNEGRVVTRSMLLEHVWDYHFDPQTNIIDQHVKIGRASCRESVCQYG